MARPLRIEFSGAIYHVTSRGDRREPHGTGVKLWETALRQQIYLGDDSFVARMQSLLDPKRKLDVDVPHVQRHSKPTSITGYLTSYDRDEAIGLAYREGGHTMSAIARELGLSVARISRLIAAQEAKGKT